MVEVWLDQSALWLCSARPSLPRSSEGGWGRGLMVWWRDGVWFWAKFHRDQTGAEKSPQMVEKSKGILLKMTFLSGLGVTLLCLSSLSRSICTLGCKSPLLLRGWHYVLVPLASWEGEHPPYAPTFGILFVSSNLGCTSLGNYTLDCLSIWVRLMIFRIPHFCGWEWLRILYRKPPDFCLDWRFFCNG